ncbi:GTP cyclohydrolase [Saccharophagus sp. K07]|jgi:riboflavin-specific deaminase-like protein|uniref:RibD family protein n=1 Tax=Saccharophagus sp. K07 TaxID=2283636 RepID=UPI0016520CC1|nr:RibD family protein [Saccharophagus sp. K07]MBC6907021.1 GTP cyclohydrolase [Saccharophagus sp. K07]
MNVHQVLSSWLLNSQQEKSPHNRPFVTLSYAQSLDGSIARSDRKPLILSGEESMRITHQLRSLHDGILVGIGTVLTDDPQLTVRHWQGENPQPIILDSRCRIPMAARLCHRTEKNCWVLTTCSDMKSFDGVEIYQMQANEEGRVCLKHALEFLYERGIKRLMVEGGAQIITSFLQAGLVDALVLTICPRFIGGYRAVQSLHMDYVSNLESVQSARLNDDLLIWGSLRSQKV